MIAAVPPLPTFSVVIPVYNDASRLRECLQSVQTQTLGSPPIVVVDDGSSEIPETTWSSLRQADIQVVRSRENEGPSSARNRGAAVCSTSWIVFLDADDLLVNDALEIFEDAMHSESRLVCSHYGLIEAPRQAIEGFLPGAFAVRTDVFRRAGGYDPELRYSENWELRWRLQDVLRLEGVAEQIIGDVTVLRSSHDSRQYDRRRMDAAILLLNKHHERFRENPKERGLYESIASVNAMRRGDWTTARAYALRAARSDPTVRNIARVPIAWTAPLRDTFSQRLSRRDRDSM